MEKTIKNLKITSICVLILAGLSLLQAITELFFGKIDTSNFPEGVTDEVLLAAKIILCVISVVLLLPQIFVGIKGIKIAKTPSTTAKAAIVWAVILLVLSALGLISAVTNLVQQANVFDNVLSAVSALADVVIFFEYIKCVKAITKAN